MDAWQSRRWSPRAVRYQVARFCQWEARKGTRWEHRIPLPDHPGRPGTGQEPGAARQPAHRAAAPLQRRPAAPQPRSRRWSVGKTRAPRLLIEKVVLLRVTSPEILDRAAQDARRALSGRIAERNNDIGPRGHRKTRCLGCTGWKLAIWPKRKD